MFPYYNMVGLSHTVFLQVSEDFQHDGAIEEGEAYLPQPHRHHTRVPLAPAPVQQRHGIEEGGAEEESLDEGPAPTVFLLLTPPLVNHRRDHQQAGESEQRRDYGKDSVQVVEVITAHLPKRVLLHPITLISLPTA